MEPDGPLAAGGVDATPIDSDVSSHYDAPPGPWIAQHDDSTESHQLRQDPAGVRFSDLPAEDTRPRSRAGRIVSDIARSPSQLARKVSQRIPGFEKFLGSQNPEISQHERKLYYNQPLPMEDLNPETGFPTEQYPRNKIRTTKYTPLNFIPLDIFHQFHNIANIYFLFIVILSAISIFGVQNPGLSAVPIIAIVIITAIKDAIEDYRRAVLDSELNNTVTTVLSNYNNPNVVDDDVSGWRRFKKASTRLFKSVWLAIKRTVIRHSNKGVSEMELPRLQNAETDLHSVVSNNTARSDISSIYDGGALPGSNLNLGQTQPSNKQLRSKDLSVLDRSKDSTGQAKFRRNYWKNVKCGDIVKVFNDEEVPADVVVLSTSDPEGACYIETRNLDGETNLKSRQSLQATSTISRGRDLERCMFRIECEKPNPALYSFSGVLKWDQRANPDALDSAYAEHAEPISINNLLLRGSSVRNTKWAICMVVYTGIESKIMLNAGTTPAKRSRMTRSLNFNVICNFVSLFVLAFVAGLVEGLYFRKDNTSARFFEFGSIGGSAPVDGLITFWAAVILLQNLIPISLYISIEIVKTIQAFFIYSDVEMYYEPIDYPCVPKSWSISDDVGQVEYIFSDKTGTLTQNVMEFKKCTINGVAYGSAFTEAMMGMLKREGHDAEKYGQQQVEEIARARVAMLEKLRAQYDNPLLFDEDLALVSDQIVDDMNGASGQAQKDGIDRFLMALSLCHSAIPERVGENDEKIVYKAPSPDDAALVSTAKDLGYTFTERNRAGVAVDVRGQILKFEVLNELEFTSARKRMSVILHNEQTGKILLICKGADSVIYARLSRSSPAGVREATMRDLQKFANEGLRTLCVAQRELSVQEYKKFKARYDEAAASLDNREEKVEIVCDEIERELTLLGGTAIEDRLQEGVPDAIALLGQAGIKLWVLTGDKVETAINIGYSCNLLDNNMQLMVFQLQDGSVEQIDGIISQNLQEKFGLTGSDSEVAAAKLDHTPPGPTHAVVIDGDTLALVLQSPELRTKFVLLCKQCRSVLCCRVSPSQKAHVVKMVKSTLDVTTLSIGDGANDVAMIQEADVGVGIAGVEGRQAVMSSDYAFGQFRFLTRLVLVHGRWSYNRVAEMTANLFYKNVVFTLTLFWFDVHDSFDGSYLFDYTYITLFNLAFTSLPVIFMGFSDQDVSDKVILAVPQLYRRGILRQQWTNRKFWIYSIDGAYQSAVCYFFSFGLFFDGGFLTTGGQQNNYLQAYGVFTATTAIIACNLYVLLNEMRWDWLFGLIVGISIMLVFFWTGIYTQFQASEDFYKSASSVYGCLPFWANSLVALVACLLPRFAYQSYQKMFRPSDVDIIREQVILHQFDYLWDDEQPESLDPPHEPVLTESAKSAASGGSESFGEKTFAAPDAVHRRGSSSHGVVEGPARTLLSTTQLGQ